MTEKRRNVCTCGRFWRGEQAAHCAACHITFNSVSGFDEHRRAGACLDPITIGMVPISRGEYEVWARRGSDEEIAAFAERRRAAGWR